MSKLSELVVKYFPQEKIQVDDEMFFSTSQDTIFGKKKIPFLNLANSLPIKIPVVETTSMIFFDVRPIYYSFKPWIRGQKPFLLIFSILLMSFIIIFFIYFIFSLILSTYNQPNIFGIFILLFLLIGMPLVLLQNKTIADIFVIKKSWVSADNTTNGVRNITWSMPENELKLTFVQHLDDKSKKKLPLFVKFQEKLSGNRLNKFWIRKISFVDWHNIVFILKKLG